MGTFTDNLLKLTEFPFSYSFIGVLVLIAGGRGFLNEELSLANLGPLLILMGFVATTLSISDPIGRLQKALLVRGDGFEVKEYHSYAAKVRVDGLDIHNRLPYALAEKTYIFGDSFVHYILRKVIPIHIVMCLHSNFQDYRNNNNVNASIRSDKFWPTEVFEKLKAADLEKLSVKIRSLKRKTVETVWITREIDKITSMAYFIIVVATFTYAVLSIPNVVDKFVDSFQGTESVQNEQTQASEDAASDGRILTAKIITAAFSFVALGAVLTILIKRARELTSKCLTTFKFLVLQHAIKIKRDIFEKRLQEIRQFLVDGDWTLAEVEVERLMEEYDDLVKKEWVVVAEEKEIIPEETMSKDIEKRIMIKWKNGEMSVEEVKGEVEEKVSAEEIKNAEH